MKWLKRVAVVVVVVIAIVAVAPFFIRLNDYIPTIEKEVSARIGEPVSIKSLRVALLPTPRAVASDITIGGAEKISFAKLTVVPNLWSLLRDVKVMRSIELEDVKLPQKSLGAIVALTQADRAAGKVRVEEIHLSNAEVKLEKSTFGPFDVDVDVSEAGKGGHLTLKTRDGALRAEVTPQN